MSKSSLEPTCNAPLRFSTDKGHLLGEWAIARLQAEAAQQLNDLKDDPQVKPDTAAQASEAHKDPIRLGRYHCTYEKAHGNLSLDTEGVFFELHLTAKEKWRLKYTELKSVQKVNPHDSNIYGW